MMKNEHIKIKMCRLCGTPLSQPVLKLENLPRGSYFLPTYEQLNDDFGIDLDIYQCDACGLTQLIGEQILYTDQVSNSHAHSQAMIAHRKHQAYQFVERFDLRDKKVLEIGCGDGYFLEFLSEAGAESFGIETAKKSIEIGCQKGLQIQQGYICKNYQIEDSPFDAFVTMHVLEHVRNPNDFLQAIYENTTDNAVGLIEVPSLEKILENSRFYDFIIDHLSYFCAKTLSLALEKNGFDILEIERNWEGEHLVATVQKRKKKSFEPLSNCLNYLTQEITDFVGNQLAMNKRVAIWGASYQCQTLLSLTKLKGVAYIVDDSPYKQGRFTANSHFPIVEPSKLKTEPVDTVMVMAPRFSDQIVGKLQNDLQFTGTIAVLQGKSLEILTKL